MAAHRKNLITITNKMKDLCVPSILFVKISWVNLTNYQTHRVDGYYNFVPTENICNRQEAWKSIQTIYSIFIIGINSDAF